MGVLQEGIWSISSPNVARSFEETNLQTKVRKKNTIAEIRIATREREKKRVASSY